MPLNRVLTDADRADLASVQETMKSYCPEMFYRKIANSMVQFAFCYNTARQVKRRNFEESPFVLSAGSHEDIATECLKLDGYSVVGIDPVINCDLHTFRQRWYTNEFDIIVSASVLEHVENDEEFVADCCDLLKPGGTAIFTMDFKDDWHPGHRVPTTSRRFYTSYDLMVRLPAVLERHSCRLADSSDYTARDHFQWEGINYSFASFVFIKKDSV